MEKVVGRCRAAAVVHHRSQAAVENNFLAFDQDNLAVAVVLVDNTVEDLRDSIADIVEVVARSPVVRRHLAVVQHPLVVDNSCVEMK
jgi:hypothetical protein